MAAPRPWSPLSVLRGCANLRLPVPTLWLDVMQKIRALGFNAISFYVDWALLEGKEGEIRGDGVFDLRPFFDAALEAGIWLIAVSIG